MISYTQDSHTPFYHFFYSFWRYLNGAVISLPHLSQVVFRFTFTGNYFTREEIELRSNIYNYDHQAGWVYTRCELDNWENYQDNSSQKILLQLSGYFRWVCFELNYLPNCFNFPFHFVWCAPKLLECRADDYISPNILFSPLHLPIFTLSYLFKHQIQVKF